MNANAEMQIKKLAEALKQDEKSLLAFAFRTLAARGPRPNAADLEDLLSTAFLEAAKLLRDRKDLRVTNYTAWFRRILYFTCMRHLRDRRKVEVVGLDELIEADQLYDRILVDEGSGDTGTKLEELLEQLSDESRRVLERSAQGYTSREIAEDIGKSADAVRQIKSRGIAALKSILNDEG